MQRSLLLAITAFALLLPTAASLAVEKDIEVDILVTRITSLMKEGKHAEALPLFEKVEGMNVKVPERFDFYYIDTLDKAGKASKVLERSEAYLKKYGKKGKYYGQVIEIVGRRSADAEKERIAEEARLAKARAESEKVERAAAAARDEVRTAITEIETGMVRIPYSTPFLLGKTEVTQKQWRAVMGNNPSHFSNCGDSCPVESVSWDDIQIFLQKLNAKTGRQYRLPTEAEWEYACYGGSKTKYCGGDDIDSVAWYDINSGNTTHPVGQKRANGYGLHDMSGNVWEWMENKYDNKDDWRAIRGGSRYNEPQNVRADNRNPLNPAKRYILGGFRLARTSP